MCTALFGILVIWGKFGMPSGRGTLAVAVGGAMTKWHARLPPNPKDRFSCIQHFFLDVPILGCHVLHDFLLDAKLML